MLEMLSWRVRVPTPTSFLTLLLPACGATSAVASSLSELPRDDSAHVHISAGEPLVQRASRLLVSQELKASVGSLEHLLYAQLFARPSAVLAC